MTAFEVSPVHILNRYVYDLLRVNGAIGPRSDYGGKTPIVPSQQQPDFNTYGKPYLVYGFTEDPSGDLYVLKTGSLAYAIYAVNDDRPIIKIVNLLRAVFERFDESAADVNNYAAALPSALGGITFTSISVGLSEGPGPAEQEGGQQAGVVMLNYQYKIDRTWTVPTVS